MELSLLLSRKFRFWSFISMVLLVFVHGYNLNIRYLQPWTIPGQEMNFTTFTEYFLANGIFRFRIPMLFIISGYLFALHDYQIHKQRIKKRIRTLLLPYLLWSAIGIIFTFLLECFPAGRHLVADSHILKIDDTRQLLHEYHWYELLARWILIPVPYQLWFIRVLLIYNLAYPFIRWCVTNRKASRIFFPITVLLWLATAGFIFFEGEGLLFFSLGVWMQKTNFNIEKPVRWLKPAWWGITFIMLAAIKTIIAFIAQPIIGNVIYPLLSMLHKLMVISGLISCWFGLNHIVKWAMEMKWFSSLTAFSFFIYSMHAPLVAYLINPALLFLADVQGTYMLAFILLPLIIIALSIGSGALLRRLSPQLYGLLTGGRGI